MRIFVVIMTAVICFMATAADEPKEQPSPEVMSSLEQRMQKRISVNFRGTPIDDVIRVMAAQADVDIVKSPKVVGEVTTTLTDIPLSEALTNILAAQGYGYITSKNMIRVAPLSEINNQDEKMEDRIYRITRMYETEYGSTLRPVKFPLCSSPRPMWLRKIRSLRALSV